MEKEAGQVPQFADQPVFAVDFDGYDLHADHVSVSIDFYWFVNDTFSDRPPTPAGKYTSGAALERMWHEEAAGLRGASPEAIEQKLNSIRQEYPEISMFWVDGGNETRLRCRCGLTCPRYGRALYRAIYENSRDSDPFTSVALLGRGSGEGFMVMQRRENT